METRKNRINSQIERSKEYYRRCKAKKFGKFSLFTGTTIGLSGFFANSISTKAVSEGVQTSQNDNGLKQISNPAPNSGYNFSQGLNQIMYLTQSQYKFLSDIAPRAQKIAADNNLYASIMIAQAIIESGWGQSGLASAPNYNLFGVKGSYMGNSVSMPTFEQTPSGVSYQIVANFAKYPSYEDSMKGYVKTMMNPIYVGAWRSNTNNYQEAAHYLTGRYATAVNYGDTLISMIQKYNLTSFDNKEYSVDPALKGISFSKQKETYQIQKGDSLWGISRKFGVSLSEILKLNNLNLDSKIFPDQVITIKETQNLNLPNVEIVPNSFDDNSSKPSLPVSTTTNPNNVKVNDTDDQQNNKLYTVQKGDSLYRIALKNGISLADLLRINNLTENSSIYPGQVLKISDNVVNPNNISQTPTESGNEYVVQKGDTLYHIANKVGININDLLEINNLQANSVIRPGQKLIIRSSINHVVPNHNVGDLPSTDVKDDKIEGTNYVVKNGDSLHKIAQRAGISLEELLNLNNLKEDAIIVEGQTLLIKKLENQKPTQIEKHLVQKGETLYQIAKKNNVNLNDLLAWNNLKIDSTILPGQELLIKNMGKNSDEIKHQEQAPDDNNTYIVMQGDTLYKIAKEHNLSLADLLKLNNIDESSMLMAGQRLIIKNTVKENNDSDSNQKKIINKSDFVFNSGNHDSNEGNKVAPTQQKTYTVKQGDSLYKIATANKTTINQLEELNDLKGGFIIPGQVLKLS